MSPPNSSYDVDLLVKASAATRTEMQEGYTIELLDINGGGAAAANPTVGLHFSGRTMGDGRVAQKEESVSLVSRKIKPPFWRTGNGIGIIIVIAIIILGAVIGGAVGGTVGKSKLKRLASNSTESLSTSSSAGASTTYGAPYGSDGAAKSEPTASAPVMMGSGSPNE